MKINPLVFYRAVYKILDEVTPLKFDCGTLCNHICCQDTDSGEGMYLYPYEELMFNPVPKWVDISDSDFTVVNRITPFLTCSGHCVRTQRPLACRIFPLVPYIDKYGKPLTILDPRSIPICPLSKHGVSDSFRNASQTVTSMLFKVTDIRAFLEAQSRLIDDYIEINNLFSEPRK